MISERAIKNRVRKSQYYKTRKGDYDRMKYDKSKTPNDLKPRDAIRTSD